MFFRELKDYIKKLDSSIKIVTPTLRIESDVSVDDSELSGLKEKYIISCTNAEDIANQMLENAHKTGFLVGHKKKIKIDKETGLIS